MGCGASSHKTSVQPFNDQETTTRSGDAANDPRPLTKQLASCAERLKKAEDRCSELTGEVGRLNTLVAELEGQKLDLEDRLSLLENEMEVSNIERPTEKYEETLKAKDQIIADLEMQIRTNEANLKKARVSWRRKLRNYATQLAEEKHESAIRVMELRQEVYRLNEENERLRSGKGEAPPADAPKDNLIVELSQKLMEQTEAVQRMEISIRERDVELERLESANSQSSKPPGGRRGPRRSQPDSREWSGYSHDSGLDSDAPPDSAGLASRRRPGSGNGAVAASLSPLTEKEAAMAREDDADIAEDCNWDAASLDADSEDTIGASPRLMAIAARQERSRSIILDPDKAQTIDSLLAGP